MHIGVGEIPEECSLSLRDVSIMQNAFKQLPLQA